MRFARRLSVGFAGALLMLGAFGVFLPIASLHADDQSVQCDPTQFGGCPEESNPDVQEVTPPAPAAPAPEPTPCDITRSVKDQDPCDGADINGGGLQTIIGTGKAGTGAQGLIFANICPSPKPTEEEIKNGATDSSCPCRAHGQCSLNDVLQVFVNVTILILGISGSVVLLMFVYGGFLWVTSRGETKRVDKGRETITHAVVGFAIILLSYTLINFLIAALAGDTPGKDIPTTINNAITPN